MSKKEKANWQNANREKDKVSVGGRTKIISGGKGTSVTCCYRYCVDYLTAVPELLTFQA